MRSKTDCQTGAQGPNSRITPRRSIQGARKWLRLDPYFDQFCLEHIATFGVISNFCMAEEVRLSWGFRQTPGRDNFRS